MIVASGRDIIYTNRKLGNPTEMNRQRWIAILIFTACTAFAIGWHIEYRRTRSTSVGGSGRPIDDSQSTQAAFECDADVPDDHWKTIQTLGYQPVKTLYTAVWDFCPADLERRRVRVMDANFQKIFYEYEDDEILRVEKVELSGDHVPQLLIVTGSSGTNDRIDWHVLSEVNDQLYEWTWPDYNAPAESYCVRTRVSAAKNGTSTYVGTTFFLPREFTTRMKMEIAAKPRRRTRSA